MNEHDGTDGVLINLLMGIVDHDPAGDDEWWVDVSGLLADAIGGCQDIAPESNRAPVDGRVAWEHQGNREVVARVTWMNRLRLRLAGLVGDGLSEAFLVRSLREHLDRELRRTDASGGGANAQSKYDEWIAQQATGTDNLELSLVARALMGPAPASTDTTAESPRIRIWSTASAAIDDTRIDAWASGHSAAVGSASSPT